VSGFGAAQWDRKTVRVLAAPLIAATARYVWSPVYVNALVLRDFATGTPGTLNQRLWVQQDANWNVTALVNGSGVVVERYIYTPYGVVTVLNASWGTLSGSAYSWVYGFQGMRYDPTSGLYESQSRWYSPTLQRWISIDPLRYGAGDADLYRMEGNGPVDRTDPSGLDSYPPGWNQFAPYPGNGAGAPPGGSALGNFLPKRNSFGLTLAYESKKKEEAQNFEAALAKDPARFKAKFREIKTTEELVKMLEELGKDNKGGLNLKYVVKSDGTLIVFEPDGKNTSHAMATAFPLKPNGDAGEFGANVQAAGWIHFDAENKVLNIDLGTAHYGLGNLSNAEKKKAGNQALAAFGKLQNNGGLIKQYLVWFGDEKWGKE
jgi:RHS repeat-associated protein